MKSKLFLIGGFLMAPVCFFGLFYQWSAIWAICPQALVVMFLRQSLHSYDSLAAADIPDIAAGMLYYVLVGWLLARASKAGTLRKVAVRLIIWHIAAIGLAVLTGIIRNRLWFYGS